MPKKREEYLIQEGIGDGMESSSYRFEATHMACAPFFATKTGQPNRTTIPRACQKSTVWGALQADGPDRSIWRCTRIQWTQPRAGQASLLPPRFGRTSCPRRRSFFPRPRNPQPRIESSRTFLPSKVRRRPARLRPVSPSSSLVREDHLSQIHERGKG
jgi:hypothetical protein